MSLRARDAIVAIRLNSSSRVGITRRSGSPPAAGRRSTAHAAEAGKGGIVLVDSAPVVPRLAEGVHFSPVFEQVGDFADEGAQGRGRGLGEEREQGFDEGRRRGLALPVPRDLRAEGVDFGAVVL